MATNSEGLPIIEGIKLGDSIDFEGTVVDTGGTAIDCTGWLIRAEMYDDKKSIKKGSAGVTGGADEQAEWSDAANGVFQVHFLNNETNVFATEATIEVEVETSASKRFTVYQGELQFDPSRISWTDVT